MGESLERIEPGTDTPQRSILERARAAARIAAIFGGYFTVVTAFRIIASVVAERAFPSLKDLGDILFVLVACFLGFGGLAFIVKLLGMPIFSKNE